ncbi:MAG: hypothetical protein Kow0059_00380 [Candidatus Sumerlaeia bacterium]
MLQRSAASAHNAGLWDFPGGKVDPDEVLEEAVRREVREETGLDIILVGHLGGSLQETPVPRLHYIFFEARLAPGPDDAPRPGTDCSGPGDPPESARPTTVRLSPEHCAAKWLAPAELFSVKLCPQFRNLKRKITQWLE